MIPSFKPKDARDRMRSSMIEYLGKEEVFAYDPYSEGYLVSNYGRVFSLRTNKFLKPTKNSTGYYYVRLYSKYPSSKSVHLHRVVARTFLNMLNYEVNHIDANKANNALSNLELVTRQENIQHAKDNKLFKGLTGYKSPSCKFNKEIIDNMVSMKNNGSKLKEIANKYNTSQSYVCTLIKMKERGLR